MYPHRDGRRPYRIYRVMGWCAEVYYMQYQVHHLHTHLPALLISIKNLLLLLLIFFKNSIIQKLLQRPIIVDYGIDIFSKFWLKIKDFLWIKC